MQMNNESEIKSFINEVDDILMEEENSFDNLSEGLQCTMRGQAMEEAIDNLEEAISCLEDDDIETAIEYLEDAMM